ncbi:MAG TPA: HlyD family secretion protein [Verrucomicrobiae bacterium]|nr:HlyD family secretion protein [Verrucomicrobiae bacterium]
MEQENGAPEPAQQTPRSGNGGRKIGAGMVLLLLVAAALAYGGHWWYTGSTRVSTDNAFIEGRIHAVSARVPGHVLKVAVADNQRVKKGDLLVELDAADYRVRVTNASASLAMARNETSGEYAQVETAQAGVTLAKARLEQAETDLKRGEALVIKEVIPREQVDRLRTARTIATSQLKEAEESLRRARALLGIEANGGKEARVAQKASVLEEARLQLSHTRILAPADGYVTRRGVEEGNNVQAGQPLMAVVSLDEPWLTANYKERQLAHVRPGQKVTFTVDAYPGRRFTGTVDSIMAGTGAAFSLLPPENATGNYVKVVQRIPVKIRIDRTSDPENLLRVGMSAVPVIDTGRSFGEFMHEQMRW